jgi:2-deoxy-D-gluconate 3-dehydrogenase
MVAVSFDLSGRTAAVTGAGSGLGRAMAVAMAQAGASLVLVDTDGASLGSLQTQLEATGHAVAAEVGDVTDLDFLDRCLAASIARFQRADILLFVAGRALRKDALDTTLEEYDRLMDTNVRSLFFWNNAFGRHMIEMGGSCIVNIASQGAFTALDGRPAYCASKAAVVQLSKAPALDWIGRGVRVNAIAPSLMHTPFIDSLKATPERFARAKAHIPAGRLGTPEDLVGPILLLVSDAGRYIVGQTMVVDGGWTIS